MLIRLRWAYVVTILQIVLIIAAVSLVLNTLDTITKRASKDSKENSERVFAYGQQQNQCDSQQDPSQTQPIIFVGGFPRSGTTLMRAILDARSDVRCGPETQVIPKLLFDYSKWLHMPADKMEESGITLDVLKPAIKAFIWEIILRHGAKAKVLCNKDPYTLMFVPLLKQIFPKSRFVLMIRDGRASVHSLSSRHVGISGINSSDIRASLSTWNSQLEQMTRSCREAGPLVCMAVHYEELVLNQENLLRRVINFLELPWDDAVLHHEQQIGKDGGIVVSKLEPSSSQIEKALYNSSLASWVEYFPHYLIPEVTHIAPMLEILGYRPHLFPPDYSNFKPRADYNFFNAKNKT